MCVCLRVTGVVFASPEAMMGDSVCACALYVHVLPAGKNHVGLPQTPRCANRFQPALHNCRARAPIERPCLISRHRCTLKNVLFLGFSAPKHRHVPALFPSAARNGAPAPLPLSPHLLPQRVTQGCGGGRAYTRAPSSGGREELSFARRRTA